MADCPSPKHRKIDESTAGSTDISDTSVSVIDNTTTSAVTLSSSSLAAETSALVQVNHDAEVSEDAGSLLSTSLPSDHVVISSTSSSAPPLPSLIITTPCRPPRIPEASSGPPVQLGHSNIVSDGPASISSPSTSTSNQVIGSAPLTPVGSSTISPATRSSSSLQSARHGMLFAQVVLNFLSVHALLII